MTSHRCERFAVSAVVLLLAMTTAGFAQTPDMTVRRPDRFDISPPMRDMPAASERIPGLFTVIPLLRTRPQNPVTAPPELADSVLQSTPGPSLNVTPGIHFDGVGVGLGSYSDCCAPPDTNMAVGPNHIVQWVNLDYAVFDKTGNLLPGYPKSGSSIWSGFGGLCGTTNSGDPIAQYDALADRWVMSQLAASGFSFGQCFAVSTTNDPTGSFARYEYDFGNSLGDYPKIGIWPTGYFASYNMFFFGAIFQGARACAYDRSAMLAGNSSATQICFQQSASVDSLLPSDLDGITPPPSGSPDFFVNFTTSALQMWKFTPNFANPGSSTFTGPTNIPVAAFSEACGGGTCIPQLNSTQQLDSLADRLMYRLAYRNFGDHESLVVNHSITAGSSVGVRWYELRDPNGSVNLFQSGTFAPDSNFRWMGSIAMDKAGNMGLGYSVSSSSMFPAISYTGRESGDPLGTMQSENLLVAGGGSQQPTLSRWGDYSAMRIDPSDDCTFWYTTEYLKSSGTFNWSTHIGSFKFSSCGGPPPPPPAAPTGLTATPISSSRIDLAWTDNSTNEDGFKIERCTGAAAFCDTNPANFAQIAQVGANVTTYSDTGLAASTTYSYRVRAFNSGGNSGYSNTADATTLAPNPPAAPSNLTATAVSSSQINLAWQDNSSNEDGFKIERCTGTAVFCTANPGNFAQITQVGANVTTYSDMGLAANTTYSYRVRAFNGDGNSGYSNIADATTLQAPPAAPSNLTATPNKQGGTVWVDLAWTDNSNNEDSFDIERCTGAGCTSFAPLASVGANTTTYRDNTVARRTTYRYRVKASNAIGSSAYSNIATATTR